MTDYGAYLSELRTQRPLVHCMTNFVSMTPVANSLLAAGGAPAMVVSPTEAPEFAPKADALLINIGTLNPNWVGGMQEAARAARGAGKPWLLDPVAAGGTRFRRGAALDLLDLGPTVIKGNASEILALTDAKIAGRGVDAAHAVTEAEAAAIALSHETGAMTVITGPVDFLTDGQSHIRIENGHPLMEQVTAMGCALGGIMAGFLGIERSLDAVAAALLTFTIAGEKAAQFAKGPGSFAVEILDALAALTPSELTEHARVTAP